MSVFLGIDVGTSGTKTLAIRGDGKILASATVEYPLSTPKPGWSEQDPEHWWQAAIQSVRQVCEKGKISSAEVAGIGLSGQMHGSVFLNAAHEVIRPAILWNDQRTTEECRDIESAVGGRAKLIDLVANPALEGFTAPKILWLRKNETEQFEQTVQ
jgi:xylulokinase